MENLSEKKTTEEKVWETPVLIENDVNNITLFNKGGKTTDGAIFTSAS